MNKDKQIKRLKAELKEANEKNLHVISIVHERQEDISSLNNMLIDKNKSISELSDKLYVMLSDKELVERQLKDKTSILKITGNKLTQERTSLMNLYDLSQRIKEQSGISPLIMMIEELAKEGVEDRRKYQERKERR